MCDVSEFLRVCARMSVYDVPLCEMCMCVSVGASTHMWMSESIQDCTGSRFPLVRNPLNDELPLSVRMDPLSCQSCAGPHGEHRF